jgi:DNA modification methylase
MKGENKTFAGGSARPNPDYNGDRGEGALTGTSVFDPVLCELAYRWFSPPGGKVLDPFAGGSVRGIVAAKLGREYTGIDLSAVQIAANEQQAAEIVPEQKPTWIIGDSADAATLAPGEYDFVFSCPPYYDLEIYGDNPADLSNAADYAQFTVAYEKIIAQCVAMLKPNRFACFTVGNIRDKAGYYHNLVADTVTAFEKAGARFWNDAVLVTAVGSLPIRVGKAFVGKRKLGKTHQNVLVFYKGDPKKIEPLPEKMDDQEWARILGNDQPDPPA